jgi:hypothetical protein
MSALIKVAVVAVVVSLLPDIKRYVEIAKM